MILKSISLLLLPTALVLLLMACGGGSQPSPDIEATVEERAKAMVEATAQVAPTTTAVPPAPTTTAVPPAPTATAVPPARTSEPSPTPEPVMEGDLGVMLDLVASNKVAAEAEYKGKWVEFSGKISEIKEDKFNLIPTNSDMFQMSGAECKLTKEEQSKVIGLRADQTVTVKGQVKDISTFMTTTFKIDKCQILSRN